MNGSLRECVLADGEKLRYRSFGTGPKTLVLVHGLAARAQTWTDLLPLFPSQEYTIYLLDLLGSGESDKPPKADYSIRAHSLRILHFLRRSHISGVTLIGHSLGGAIVLMAAILAQEGNLGGLVDAAVIIAGPGFIQRLPLMAEVFHKPLTGPLFVLLPCPDAWIRIGLQAAYFDHSLVDQEHIARYAPCYKDRASKRALVATCRTIVPPDAKKITDSYHTLALPVLLLWGRQDRIVPLSQGERLHAAITGSILEVIEECGHNPHEEKPMETFRLVDSFVCSLQREGK